MNRFIASIGLALAASMNAQKAKVISHVKLDGSDKRIIVTAAPNPTDVLVDHDHRRIWWTDLDLEEIKFASLDGTGQGHALRLLGHISTSLTGLKLDITAGKMYFSDLENGIRRANFLGSGLESVVALEEAHANDVEIADGRIFWADVKYNSIRSANLDGSSIVNLINESLVPRNLAIHDGQLYWTTAKGTSIRRARLDGTAKQDIIDMYVEEHTDVNVDVDVGGGRIIWTDKKAGRLCSAAMDGSDIREILTGLASPTSLALDSKNNAVYYISDQTPKHDGEL